MMTKTRRHLPELSALLSVVFVAALLAHEHFNGGVRSHHLLDRRDSQTVSNWESASLVTTSDVALVSLVSVGRGIAIWLDRAVSVYSNRSNSFINGSRRTRTALARNTALARAGAAVGMARKLAPVGLRSLGTVMTSTALGSCAMLASG